MNARNRLALMLVALASLGPAAVIAADADAAAARGRAPAIHKPHAPVDARFEVPGTPTVGAPTDVAVRIVSGSAAEFVEVAFSAGEGLTVLSPTGTQRLAVRRGEPLDLTVRVVPASGGDLRLTAVITAINGASRQSRSVSTGLAVKGPATVIAAKPARTERDARGTLIEPMQAETVAR